MAEKFQQVLLNGNKFHRKLGASRNAPKYNLAKQFLKEHSYFYAYVFSQDIYRISLDKVRGH